MPGIVAGWAPWTVEFPMREPPYLTKEEMLDQARADGLVPPRLYELGFAHNNFFWATGSAAACVLKLHCAGQGSQRGSRSSSSRYSASWSAGRHPSITARRARGG
jgi:hypothetical protein